MPGTSESPRGASVRNYEVNQGRLGLGQEEHGEVGEARGNEAPIKGIRKAGTKSTGKLAR